MIYCLVLSTSELYVNRIILYVYFVDSFLSFRKSFERFIHVDVLNKW